MTNQKSIFRPDVSGRFLCRLNRFVVEILPDNSTIPLRAHAPNPGRLHELYIPGRRVLLEESANPKRKYPHTLAAIQHGKTWVPLVSSAANRVAIDSVLPAIKPGAYNIRGEVPWGAKRFDIGFSHQQNPAAGSNWLAEVKSCSLVESGLGMFPDAPSIRAREHVEILSKIQTSGERSCLLLFVINHSAPGFFAPNYHNDPEFARSLIKAREAGVEIRCANTSCESNGNYRLEPGSPEVSLQNIEDIISADRGQIIEIFTTPAGEFELMLKTFERNFTAEYKKTSPELRQKTAISAVRIPIRSSGGLDFKRFLIPVVEACGDSKQTAEFRWSFPANPLHYPELNRTIFEARHQKSLIDLGLMQNL